jgi:hypothetical protein
MSENSNANNKIQMNTKTAAQLLTIIKNSNQEVMNRIPKGFIRFLEIESKDTKEEIINFENPNWEDELEEETQVYLALIYRDYIVSIEQRKELIEEEKKLRKLQTLNERYATNQRPQQEVNTIDTNDTNEQQNVVNNENNINNINNMNDINNLNNQEQNKENNQVENQEESKDMVEIEGNLNWFQKFLKRILRL